MTISVIIPTFNEAENITELVNFIRQLRRPEVVEILVVDGGSTDSTCLLAQKSGASVITSDFRSRSVQMNLGAQRALGDILYFVHADVKPVTTFVDDIRESLVEGFESGCYRYIFNSEKFLLKVNAYFTRFDAIMCRGGDQTLYVKKSVFRSLGGFDESYSIMEDYNFIIRLRKKHTFKIIQKDIIVSARKYETNSWFRVQIANLSFFILFFFRRSPREMKQIYKILLTYR
jgi:rSAM/selenodomain-associated transferase 2